MYTGIPEIAPGIYRYIPVYTRYTGIYRYTGYTALKTRIAYKPVSMRSEDVSLKHLTTLTLCLTTSCLAAFVVHLAVLRLGSSKTRCRIPVTNSPIVQSKCPTDMLARHHITALLGDMARYRRKRRVKKKLLLFASFCTTLANGWPHTGGKIFFSITNT